MKNAPHGCRWTDGSNLAELVAGFDQEAAAVVVARLATFKMETEEDFDATRWIDRTLIRLASRCAPLCLKPIQAASLSYPPHASVHVVGMSMACMLTHVPREGQSGKACTPLHKYHANS